MASTAAILATEALQEPRIYLYREGIFWKAYQYSAYRVIQRQPGFKVNKKFVKAVACQVASIGFPDKTLYRMYRQEEITHIDEKMIAIASTDVVPMHAYQQWFDGVLAMPCLPTKAALTQQQTVGASNEPSGTVLRSIQEFPIEQSTPMDCLHFLVKVRKELKEYGYIR